MQKNKLHPLTTEFLRYLVVGGTAFLLDYGILYFSKTYVFGASGDTGVYISTALGFSAGLVYNYVLSLKYVFKKAKEQDKKKTTSAFILFAVIGVTGLLLTEGGMYLGVQALRISYLVAKPLVTGFVLIWNYAARKLLIFK